MPCNCGQSVRVKKGYVEYYTDLAIDWAGIVEID